MAHHSNARIGLVRRGYSGTGGAERYLARFAATLKNRGYEPVLFTTEAWPEAQEFSEVIRFPDGSPTSFANALRRSEPKTKCDVLFSFERVWECDFYRAGDGVHRAWLDRRRKHEVALRSATRAFNMKHAQLLRLENQLFAPGSKAEIIANSEFVKHEILQYYGKPSEMVHVVYNGYKPPAKKGDPRAETREKLGLDDHTLMLLFTGSGWERKGLAFAIKAAGLLQHEGVKLFVAGKGKSRGMPRGPVTYLGPVDDVSPYYDAADLFVLPTLYDPFSNACLEAACHGLPVITSTANGFAEIMVHTHYGEALEDPADVEKLGEAIIKWLSPEKRRAKRDEIQTWARGFSIKDNVDKTLEIILPKRSFG